MAISPPGDIVLDVARAADPATLQAARAKLMQFAEGSAGAAPFAAGGPDSPGESARTGAASPDGSTPEAFVKFEAMILQTFIQSMLPQDTESVYGEGMSGDMWKSLMAQALGENMAARGGIGIAERVLGDHYVENGRQVPLRGLPNGPEAENADKQAMLSSALVHEMQRRAAQTLGLDGATRQAEDERRT